MEQKIGFDLFGQPEVVRSLVEVIKVRSGQRISGDINWEELFIKVVTVFFVAKPSIYGGTKNVIW